MTLQHILRAAGIIRSTKISSNAIFFSIEKSYDHRMNERIGLNFFSLSFIIIQIQSIPKQVILEQY